MSHQHAILPKSGREPGRTGYASRAALLLLAVAGPLVLCTTLYGAGRSGVAFAQGRRSRGADVSRELAKLADAEQSSLEKLYLHLHKHPELSLAEKATSLRMAQEMRDAGFEVTTNVGGFGVVGVLKNGRGPVVMVRGDMDALPITEATGAPYASTVRTKDDRGEEVGVMHACGHDMHMTVLIGAGRLVSKLARRWSGTLVLVAQPAEEGGGGAQRMVDDGLYTRFPRPAFALSVHTDAGLQAGKVGYVHGPYNANITAIDITLKGVGGHGAYPHTTRDPIVLASQLVLALQTIVSREVAPTDAAVVTVGSIHGGTRSNIIPAEVTLQLTVRTQKEEVRQKVVSAIKRIADGVGRAAGVPDDRLPEVTIRRVLPAVLNDADLVDRATKAMKRILGAGVVYRPSTMGGDDFSIFGAQKPRVPSFMFRLGAVSAEAMARSERGEVTLPGLHSPQFLPDRSPTIRAGVLAMSAATIELLNQ